MKKILKTVLTAAIACVMAVAFSVCVYAETEDVDLPLTKAKMTNGSWGQSITLDSNDFDCSRITPESIVNVEFELGIEWTLDRAPVELILFNYTTADPQIWAKIEPYEWDTTSASFDYDAMVAMYGSDDFSTVDNLCIGDTGVAMKVTQLTITNCTIVEEETTTVSETEPEVTETEPTEAETTQAAAETEAATEATTAATTAAAEQGEGGGITGILIIVVIAAVVIAGVVVTLIVVKKSKNRFY